MTVFATRPWSPTLGEFLCWALEGGGLQGTRLQLSIQTRHGFLPMQASSSRVHPPFTHPHTMCFLNIVFSQRKKTSGNPRESIAVSWLGQNCKYHPIISSKQDEITAPFHFLFPPGTHSQQSCEVGFQRLPEFLFWPLRWSRKHSNSFWFVLQFFKRVCDLEQNASLDTSPVCSASAAADSGSEVNNGCRPVLCCSRTWDIIGAVFMPASVVGSSLLHTTETMLDGSWFYEDSFGLYHATFVISGMPAG